jgi:protein-L-isoaspartate(D-aspartate) O-methyltransferase
MAGFEDQRRAMVRDQLQNRGISDLFVLNAMGKVRREAFVPPDERDFAYSDGPLPIGHGQTISQPFIVALMTEALKLSGGERVLEIGTGSGYAAAVLAEIASEVFTIERIAELAEDAKQALEREGYANVHVTSDDGTLGWKDHAPYDAIVATAAGPSVPQSLKGQLRIGGRLVMPVGSQFGSQRLVRVTRVTQTEYQQEELDWVRFVPLIGEQGW